MKFIHELSLWASLAIVIGFLWLLSTPLGILATVLFLFWYKVRSEEFKSEPVLHINQKVWEKFNKQNEN